MSEAPIANKRSPESVRGQRVHDSFMARIKEWGGMLQETWGAMLSDGSKITTPVDTLNTIVKKAEAGEQIWEDDFGRMAYASYYAFEGIRSLNYLGRNEELQPVETKIPLGRDKKSWFQRVGTVAVDLASGLGGIFGRTDIKSKIIPGSSERVIAVSDNLTDLRDEIKEIDKAIDTSAVDKDTSTRAKKEAARNFSAKLTLAKYAERYGVLGRLYSKEAATEKITLRVRRQIEKDAKDAGRVLTPVQLKTETEDLLSQDVGGKSYLAVELERAEEINKIWKSLKSDDRHTVQFFRLMCQTFNLDPDSVVAPDGILREYNQANPFEPGQEIKFIKTVKAPGGGVAQIAVSKASVFELLESQISKTRYLVTEAHLKTLIAAGYHITYQEGNKIRLHSWTSSETVNEVAASGIKDLFLDVNNKIDLEKINTLVNDYLSFGDDASRQRLHDLVAFSTLVHNFEQEYAVPVKFTERAADTNWDTFGSAEALRSYLATDKYFTLATRKYTTGEYQLKGEPAPESFDALLKQARETGNTKLLQELALAEIRAKQFLRLLFAPHNGFGPDEASARQVFNYIHGPEGDVSMEGIGAFLRGWKNGVANFRAGENPVTHAPEVILESAGQRGYYVITNDAKEQVQRAEFVNVQKGHFFDGQVVTLSEREQNERRTLYWKAAQIKNPLLFAEPGYQFASLRPSDNDINDYRANSLPPGSPLTNDDIAEIIIRDSQNTYARGRLNADEIKAVDREFDGYVLRLNLNTDGTVRNQQYVLAQDMTREEWESYLTKRADYVTPGWMAPVEGAAGANPWQALDGGEWMNGIMATTWELKTTQMRWVALEYGERYQENNPLHWAVLVKNLLEMREKHGDWMLPFNRQNGVEFNPTNGVHLVQVASRLQGVSEAAWSQNWAAAHNGNEFNGRLTDEGKANSDLQEVLDYLRKPENWTLKDCDKGLFVDFTKKEWTDRLKDESYFVMRFEQARNTFKQILPLIRGLSPDHMIIGGKLYENGVYDVTPAKLDGILSTVMGHLPWWKAHQSQRALYQRANEHMDEELRVQIQDKLVSHAALSAHFERDKLWREAILNDKELAYVSQVRHFYRGRELVLTEEEISQGHENDFLWKAAQIKGRALNERERQEVLLEHHRLYGVEVVLTKQEEDAGMKLQGKAEMVKAERNRDELRILNDLVMYNELNNTPGISLNSILGKVIEQQMFWYALPLLNKDQLAKIKEDPRFYQEILRTNPDVQYIHREDPRYRKVREQLLSGLYAAASRTAENGIILKIFLERVTPWAIMNGPNGAANQGLHLDKVYPLWLMDNVMEMGIQFKQHFSETGHIYMDEIDGEYAYLPESVVMFAKDFYGIDIANREEVEENGGEEFLHHFLPILRDRQRLMTICFGIDYLRDKDMVGNFEWYIHNVVEKMLEIAPAHWKDIPEFSVTLPSGEVKHFNKITYARTRAYIQGKKDLDPNFSRTAREVKLDKKDKQEISRTLDWIVDLMTANDLPKNVSDQIFDQLSYFAVTRFGIGLNAETKEDDLPIVLEKIKETLLTPEGLSLYLFDIFGINVGKLENPTNPIPEIKAKLGQITSRINPPGMIFRGQRFSQDRNWHFYADRITEERHEAMGLVDAEKFNYDMEIKKKALPETEEISDWANPNYPNMTQTEVATIIKKFHLADVQRFNPSSADQTRARTAILNMVDPIITRIPPSVGPIVEVRENPAIIQERWRNYIGEFTHTVTTIDAASGKEKQEIQFIRDPVTREISCLGYHDLKEVLMRRDLNEMNDQVQHHLAHGRFFLNISTVPAILNKVAGDVASPLVEFLQRYADINYYGVGWGAAINLATSAFQNRNIFDVISSAINFGGDIGRTIGGDPFALAGTAFGLLFAFGSYYVPSYLLGRATGWVMLFGVRRDFFRTRVLDFVEYLHKVSIAKQK